RLSGRRARLGGEAVSTSRSYDIVIIGSGAGGGTVAQELAPLVRDGVRILVLEKGPRFADQEFSGHELEMADVLYQDGGAFLKRDGTMALAFASAYGGSTVVYTGTSLTAPQRVIRAWGVPGLEHADLTRRSAKYAEQNNVHALDDSLINDNNRLFVEGGRKAGFRVEQFPVNVQGCRGSSLCNLGCPNQAKQGTNRVQLPRAEREGVEVVTRAEVIRIGGDRSLLVRVAARPRGARQPGRSRPRGAARGALSLHARDAQGARTRDTRGGAHLLRGRRATRARPRRPAPDHSERGGPAGRAGRRPALPSGPGVDLGSAPDGRLRDGREHGGFRDRRLGPRTRAAVAAGGRREPLPRFAGDQSLSHDHGARRSGGGVRPRRGARAGECLSPRACSSSERGRQASRPRSSSRHAPSPIECWSAVTASATPGPICMTASPSTPGSTCRTSPACPSPTPPRCSSRGASSWSTCGATPWRLTCRWKRATPSKGSLERTARGRCGRAAGNTPPRCSSWRRGSWRTPGYRRCPASSR